MKQELTEQNQLKPVRDYRRMARAVMDYVSADTQLQGLQLRVTERINRASANVSTAVVQTTERLELARQRVTDLAQAHPQWFEPKRTLQLPSGTVKRVSATHIEIPDPKLTLDRIKEFLATHGEEVATRRRVDPKQLIRTTEEPAKVFLDQLDNDTLELLGCRRVETTAVTVKSSAPKLGKAIEKAVEPAAEEGEA